MEQIISGAGTMIMKFNYLTQDRKLYKINEKLNYSKIIKRNMP